MLDYRRQPGQARGPFPDVRRALLTFWRIEADRAAGCSFRAAVRREADRRTLSKSAGSIRAHYRQGRAADALLAAAWGALYPRLAAETRGEKL